MGEKIRTAVEIAMEKAEKLSVLSKKEKEKIVIKEKVEPILAGFFKNEIDPDKLWNKLREEKKPVLKHAQSILINSVTMGITEGELKRRINAVLALENLKKNPDTVYVEKHLNSLKELNQNYRKEKENFYGNLKLQIENNPELMVRQVNSGGKKMLIRLSAEEAINQSKDWNDFISGHERRYNLEFLKCLEMIKEELAIS